VFFAELDGHIVGLVGGFTDAAAPGAVELVSMWTAPTARRTGTGRLLMQAVLDWAASAGASEVGLWVTRGNEPAQRLYEAMGFTETGDFQPLPSDPCRDETRMSRRV
jgi:GNAT superfamily N-acetyltransferase